MTTPGNPRRTNSPTDATANRRDFMQAAGAIAATAAVGPLILHAADKGGEKLPVLGSGAYRYEVVHGWGELPDHVRWGETHGVAIDAAGFIYIKHAAYTPDAMDAIVVFDPAGKFVRSFGKEFHGGGHGIDIRNDGGEEFLYLCDIKNRQVVKTNLRGEQVWKLSYPTEPGVYQSLEQFRPTNVAFHPDGGFFVGDGYGSNYIHQYDKNAKWVRTFGGTGTDPGKMQTPHGLWLDNRPGREPALIVADRANARLQYFSLDGQFREVVEVSPGVSGVSFPAHFDLRGEVMLVPDLHARVSLFDRQNKPIVHLGHDADWTKTVLDGFKVRGDVALWQAGKFIHPHDACFDKDGNIFVVEWVPTGRVSKLRHVA